MKKNVGKERRRTVPKALRIVLIVIAILLAAVIGYACFVFLSYYRLPDNRALTVEGNTGTAAETGKEYTLVSYNIGFGAYRQNFGFFMDGGTRAKATSAEEVRETMNGIVSVLKEQDADIILVEEADKYSDRARHVDECAALRDAFADETYVFAQNYDSPYLFFPIYDPIGKAVSGLITLTRFGISSSLRRSLPVENSLTKIVDLDRCYSVSRIPVEGKDESSGKELVLYTTHLSAYVSAQGDVLDAQLDMLVSDMRREYENGNYVICGGDFNKDMLAPVGGSGRFFDRTGKNDVEMSWTMPINTALFEGTGLSVISPVDEEAPLPSCRNADGPYNPDQYFITVDGFIVSDNVEVRSSDVIDTDFFWSDHNPVRMEFVLAA